MAGYSSDQYIELFDTSCEGEEACRLRHSHVANYRVRTILAGNIFECEIYPIWSCKGEDNEARKAARHKSKAAIKAANERNAKKKLIRKINANFTERDIHLTLTYKGEQPDLAQARKDIQNYLRRVKTYRKTAGLCEIKYIYVIEGSDDAEGKRVHHHLIMSEMDRDVAERLWGKGRANALKLQPDEYGLEGLARYIVKDPRGSKRWCSSKNLQEPVISVSDKKISKRRVELIAFDMERDAKRIFESVYKNFDFNDCFIKRSEFVSGAYIYTRMRKRK